MKLFAKRITTSSLLTLFFLSLFSLATANDGVACFFSEEPEQGPQTRATYDVTMSPVRISSATSGSKGKACGVASFSGATTNAGPEDPNGPLTQKQILQLFGNVGVDKRFDDYLAGLIAMLKNDPKHEYTLTLKRVNQYLDPPVKTLPIPTKQQDENVLIVTYRPYNFDVQDIIDAMKRTNQGDAGVLLGGVHYEYDQGTQKWEAKNAHMFQPVAIQSKPNAQKRHDFKVYDPYFDADNERLLDFDKDKRVFVDIWSFGGNPAWFHLEELLLVEKRPKSSGGSYQVIAKPPTQFTGSVVAQPAPITPITPTCGNGIKEHGEECDDGNRENADDCDNACRITKCGDGLRQWASIRKEECDPPGSLCFKCVGDVCYGAICSNTCTCDVVAPRPIP